MAPTTVTLTTHDYSEPSEKSKIAFFVKRSILDVSQGSECASANVPWNLCISPSTGYTARKMRFSIRDFFSKCDQIWVTLKHGVPQWGTPLVYLLVYPYIVVFRQVSETI